ncbi:MAG TPA: beta-propeller fold lactonase family protein [Acidobacteriaceae bacterium]|jgi:6-phosphogluconolactonase (cycloisomerase 2 family)|nr:beta-propeller fold lactonase family protein [Acidobacteriaceae bacterium]
MMLRPISRVVTASMLSLAMALSVTACSNDYTVSYLYMATSQTLPHGLINAYQVDYQSGSLLALADSPIDAGGRNTVALVLAPNNLFLYTVNNFDSDVTEFAIGTDGKLYPQHTYNISGSLPTAAAIDSAGKFLYVTFTYQNTPGGTQLYTPANPGPGGISIFPINSDNSLGTPTTVNVGRNPMGITTSVVGSYVYVIEQDSTITSNLLGFSENASTGALTPLAGVTINAGNVASSGYLSGPDPSGILEDSAGAHLYVTDQTLGQVATYTISNGIPSLAGTTPTDAGPKGMAFDLSGKYLYVTAYSANALDGYTLGTGGLPTRSTVAGSVQTGTGPTCVAVSGAPSDVNPIHAVYLFTSNALSNNVTAEQLNPQDGSLDQVLGEPFGGSTLPACAVVAPAFPIRSY